MTGNYENNYPVIDDNLSNFITDYLADSSNLDIYAMFHHGTKVFEYDEEIEEDAFDNWCMMMDSIMAIHLDSWARLYYALSIQYNPTWNVDGTETTTHGNTRALDKFGNTLQTNTIGNGQTTNQIGASSTTNTQAQRNSGHSEFEMNYDSGTEKQVSRTADTMAGVSDQVSNSARTDTITTAQRIDTYAGAIHEDEHTTDQYTDTLKRGGNIGVTMTQQLLEAEYNFRKRNFFKEVIETLIMEGGCFYDE